ncbi:MAG: ATP-binding cassette domain-containing protein [Rhodospirillum sp.]|nr:ATP-binding cassette domain-containing protein [Rhodospirillum sp.]MCF8489857.1 ATP-binding cassette domain-containing protein [Rhodospirillum sp.]MCF8499420.1 ATP-binding cassette domain-containing protein [Rhodospirillum sp.]
MSGLRARLLSKPLVLIEVLVASLAVNLLALGTAVYSIQVLNRYVSHGVDATLTALTAGVVLAVLFEFAFRMVRQHLALTLTDGPDTRADAMVFDLITRTRVEGLNRAPAHLLRDLARGPETQRQGLSANVLTALLDVPFSLLSVGALFLLNPRVGAAATLFLGLALAAGLASQALMRGPGEAGRVASGRRDGILQSALRNADSVRAFNMTVPLSQAWNTHAGAAHAGRRTGMLWQGRAEAVVRLLTALMAVTVTATGAVQVVDGTLSVGALIGCNILSARAMAPLARLVQLTDGLLRARQSRAALDSFARLPREAMEGAQLKGMSGALELRDLAFLHPGATTPLFERLSLEIPPGSVVGVVGANGAGKTTLARVLMGLIEPARGAVLVDGVDLRQIDPTWWRAQIGYMPQDPRLVGRTLAETIGGGVPGMTSETLSDLVTRADLSSYMNGLRQGPLTPLEGDGAALPLGIQRRLALARALARTGRIVILDEPTEGMDAGGAAAVYREMNRLHKAGATIVVFSHDPAMLRGAGLLIDLNVKPRPRVGALSGDDGSQRTVAGGPLPPVSKPSATPTSRVS